MIKFQDWQKFAWQWLIACVVMKLLQIWFDGIGSWVTNTISISPMGVLFVVLAIFRVISGGLGELYRNGLYHGELCITDRGLLPLPSE